jgi:N-formylglutamate amidohydrolase
VRRNKPYAGGYIAEHYGAPLQGRHAVQIEINRALYMDEKEIRKLDKANALTESLLHMARALTAHVQGLSGTRHAAE